MITPELLARINELARKKRTQGLTEDELLEQRKLHAIYLAAIRGQVIDLLESIEFIDNVEKDEKPPAKKKKVLHQTMLSLEQVLH